MLANVGQRRGVVIVTAGITVYCMESRLSLVTRFLAHSGRSGRRLTGPVVSARKENLNPGTPESSRCQSSVTCGTINAKAKASCNVRLKVIPVTVWSDTSRKHEKIYAFLDEVSDTTLCTNALMKRLGARGKSVQYSLFTLGRVDNKQGFETRLNVRDNGEQAIINLRSFLSVPHLPELKQSIPSPRDKIIHAEVLRKISFPDVKGKVELLIGADVSEAHRTLEYRINSRGVPM